MKIFFYNMGCKLNQSLTKRYVGKLIHQGNTLTDEPEDADLLVISSCVVTHNAQKQFENILNRLIERYPKKEFHIIGCYEKKDYQHKVKYIDQKEIFDEKFFHINRTRVEIPIQTGCNNFCSYCIVPYHRGEEKSRNFENILDEIESLKESGVKEIILTGVNILKYRYETIDFISLVEKISQTGIERIRLSSLELEDLNDLSFKKLSEMKNVVPFFHLSIQHISNRILKLMKRGYDNELIESVVEKIWSTYKKPMLGCDIIVGFPYETDEDFFMMVDFLDKSKFSHFHIFPFSRRQNTLAYYFKENSKKSIGIEEKIKIMKNLQHKKKEKFLDSIVGMDESMIIEGEREGFYKGKSERYFDCYVKKVDGYYKGDLLKVKIVRHFEGKVYGEIKIF